MYYSMRRLGGWVGEEVDGIVCESYVVVVGKYGMEEEEKVRWC